MKLAFSLFSTFLLTINLHAQGQVNFANRVEGVMDAPVVFGPFPIVFPIRGPGPTYTAELFLVSAHSLEPIAGATSVFGTAGPGAAAIDDRYWAPKTVSVPGVPAGATATFVVGVYPTVLGTLDAGREKLDYGTSAPFVITLGGGDRPPADLLTLTSFGAGPVVPEPSTLVLGIVGAAALAFAGRRLR